MMKMQIFMSALAIFALGGAIAPPNAAEAQFGPAQSLTGVFFSNFENAKFFVCKVDDTTCAKWSEGEAYTLICEKSVCTALFDKVKSTAEGPNETAYIKTVLSGQKSLQKLPPKFLGDPGQVIRVERIETVEALKLD